MTVAENYNIKTTLDAESQKYYDDLSEVMLKKYLRFAKYGNCEKIRARFIENLYNKKFLAVKSFYN